MTVHPSCYRDQSKRDRTPSWQWIQRAINKAYTREEWIALFQSLPVEKRIEYWLKVNPIPKEIIGKLDNTVNILLKIDGIEQKPLEVEGQIVDLIALPGLVEDEE